MKALVRRRERIVRVRKVQHMQAAAHAAAAQGRVDSLELSASRLADLRGSLGFAPGQFTGAMLSNAGELAMRLDMARHGLTDAIVAARASAAQFAALRLEARIRQESAERLEEQAGAALAEATERKLGAGRPRRAHMEEEA
jgi:hypothetical protein